MNCNDRGINPNSVNGWGAPVSCAQRDKSVFTELLVIDAITQEPLHAYKITGNYSWLGSYLEGWKVGGYPFGGQPNYLYVTIFNWSDDSYAEFSRPTLNYRLNPYTGELTVND
jgi:hypothetical protein